MIYTPLFRFGVRFSFWIIQVFAVYLFLRGHNAPGGGFIAGVVSALGFFLNGIAFGMGSIQKRYKIIGDSWAISGMFLCIISGFIPVLAGYSFLEHFFIELNLGFFGSLVIGTPMVFDLGIALVVIGVVLSSIVYIWDSTHA